MQQTTAVQYIAVSMTDDLRYSQPEIASRSSGGSTDTNADSSQCHIRLSFIVAVFSRVHKLWESLGNWWLKDCYQGRTIYHFRVVTARAWAVVTLQDMQCQVGQNQSSLSRYSFFYFLFYFFDRKRKQAWFSFSMTNLQAESAMWCVLLVSMAGPHTQQITSDVDWKKDSNHVVNMFFFFFFTDQRTFAVSFFPQYHVSIREFLHGFVSCTQDEECHLPETLAKTTQKTNVFIQGNNCARLSPAQWNSPACTHKVRSLTPISTERKHLVTELASQNN